MLTITDLAERRTRLFADAAGEGITLPDERELHAAFLSASLAGKHERCRQMIVDAESRLGAARAARRIEEQREAVDRELLHLEARFHPIGRNQGAVAELHQRFAAAKAARDVAACRGLVELCDGARVAAERPPWEIDRERREAAEATRQAVERAEAARKREAFRRDALTRYGAGEAIAEAEKLGTLRLGDDGAVLYSGRPLDEAVLFALDHHAEHVRDALRQRWHDRVVVPAPAAKAAA